MNWQAVIDNPFLRDLPFKIELNGFGQILMSPASNKHALLQFEIGKQIDRSLNGGRVLTECSIETSDGVKVADVAWASGSFLERHGFATPYPEAPEVCVEVVSPSNSEAEMQHKTRLYLESGAYEVWLCSESGAVTIHTSAGESMHSGLLGGRPEIEIE